MEVESSFAKTSYSKALKGPSNFRQQLEANVQKLTTTTKPSSTQTPFCLPPNRSIDSDTDDTSGRPTMTKQKLAANANVQEMTMNTVSTQTPFWPPARRNVDTFDTSASTSVLPREKNKPVKFFPNEFIEFPNHLIESLLKIKAAHVETEENEIWNEGLAFLSPYLGRVFVEPFHLAFIGVVACIACNRVLHYRPNDPDVDVEFQYMLLVKHVEYCPILQGPSSTNLNSKRTNYGRAVCSNDVKPEPEPQTEAGQAKGFDAPALATAISVIATNYQMTETELNEQVAGLWNDDDFSDANVNLDFLDLDETLTNDVEDDNDTTLNDIESPVDVGHNGTTSNDGNGNIWSSTIWDANDDHDTTVVDARDPWENHQSQTNTGGMEGDGGDACNLHSDIWEQLFL